jgi:hypothetical protein
VVKWHCIDGFVSFVEEVTGMYRSKGKKGCEHPERLKGKRGECSPEQIKECHGEVVEHPCAKKK